jgi:hypothetical protein
MDLPQVHHLSEITTTARLHWVARDVDTSYLSARVPQPIPHRKKGVGLVSFRRIYSFPIVPFACSIDNRCRSVAIAESWVSGITLSLYIRYKLTEEVIPTTPAHDLVPAAVQP